jgi:CMP/dCMP kinase
MDDDIETINQMSAVTFSREYGSGGGEIAARLAKRLGWQLIDHEIVEHVASEMGTSIQEAEARDERTQGVLERALNSMVYLNPTLLGDAPTVAFLSNEATYRETVSRIVKAAAARGHVVIVGRGSQVLLAQQRDVLHVRVIAPFEQRVAYVMQREGVDQAAAELRIQVKDHDRARYLEAEYHRKPDDAHLYDIVLNTTVLGLESAVDIICLALQERAKRLSIQTGELGPAAGMPRYPGQPEDFRPPAVHDNEVG